MTALLAKVGVQGWAASTPRCPSEALSTHAREETCAFTEWRMASTSTVASLTADATRGPNWGDRGFMCSRPPRYAGRRLEGAGRWPRPRSRRALARDRRAQASIRTVWCARLQVPRISPSTRSAPGHTRDVQSRCPLIRPRDEKLPLCSVEQEVGIAARQQARGRGGRLGGAHGRLVVCEQPLVAEWRSDRQQRSFERGECIGRRAPRDPCPAGEPVSRGRPEDVEVASSELAARVGRVDLGSDDRPDGRRSRAVPADRDRARRRGVPERVADAERAPDLAVRHARAVELGVQPLGHPLGPQAALRACREASPARTARSRAWRRRRCGSEAPRAGRARDPPTSTTRPRRPARAARAARLSACCPASRPTPPAAATPSPPAFARRAHRPVVGTPGSAAA